MPISGTRMGCRLLGAAWQGRSRHKSGVQHSFSGFRRETARFRGPRITLWSAVQWHIGHSIVDVLRPEPGTVHDDPIDCLLVARFHTRGSVRYRHPTLLASSRT